MAAISKPEPEEGMKNKLPLYDVEETDRLVDANRQWPTRKGHTSWYVFNTPCGMINRRTLFVRTADSGPPSILLNNHVIYRASKLYGTGL